MWMLTNSDWCMLNKVNRTQLRTYILLLIDRGWYSTSIS